VGAQRVQGLLAAVLVDQHLQILQLPVLAELAHLGGGSGFVQRAGQIVQAGRVGNRPQQDVHPLGALVLQREVAGGPGLQSLLVGADSGLTGVELADGPGVAVDLGGFVQHGLSRLLVQQVRSGHLVSGRKQAPLLGSVLLHHIDGVLQLGQAAPGVGHSGVLPVEQGGVLLVVQIAVRFAHLHAPGVLEAVQQRVPVLRKSDKPEPFHFCNGH
jgi:hypothetical protein